MVAARRSGGRVYRRCGCRDQATGRQWGARCPRLTKRAHGRWYFSAQVTGLDQERIRVRRGGFATRAQAEQELVAVLGSPSPQAIARTWTMRRWLLFWLSHVEEHSRPSTARAYRSVVHHHLIPHLGGMRLSKMRVRVAQRAMDAIYRQQGKNGRLIAAGTVHRIWAVLRSALNEAYRQGLIGFNASRRLRLPNGARPHAVVWNAEREQLWRTTGVRPAVAVWDVQHLARFVEGVQDDPLFPLWWLLVMRGLRRGEVAALRGQDFDFFDRTMWVREQIVAVDGVDHIGPPKSMAGVRLLALDEFTNALLWRHWLFQHRRFASTGRNPDGYMFTHANGRPVRPDWLTRRFAQLVQQLDLPPVRLHDVRHAHASLAGAADVPVKVIQHDMGHSSSVTTVDTYWSVFANAAHAAVTATAQLLLSHANLRMTFAEASQA